MSKKTRIDPHPIEAHLKDFYQNLLGAFKRKEERLELTQILGAMAGTIYKWDLAKILKLAVVDGEKNFIEFVHIASPTDLDLALQEACRRKNRRDILDMLINWANSKTVTVAAQSCLRDGSVVSFGHLIKSGKVDVNKLSRKMMIEGQLDLFEKHVLPFFDKNQMDSLISWIEETGERSALHPKMSAWQLKFSVDKVQLASGGKSLDSNILRSPKKL